MGMDYFVVPMCHSLGSGICCQKYRNVVRIGLKVCYHVYWKRFRYWYSRMSVIFALQLIKVGKVTIFVAGNIQNKIFVRNK